MTIRERTFADHLGRLRCEQPQVHLYRPELHGEADVLRRALRREGVPVLEMNGAPEEVRSSWLAAAGAVSTEFLVPVVIFGVENPEPVGVSLQVAQQISDKAWLDARQVAITRALEDSDLNRELRQSGQKRGLIYLGWHEDAVLTEGNRLLLAWSSPLPLMRLRNFSARCVQSVHVEGPGALDLADDVASQGISVTHWQIAVK